MVSELLSKEIFSKKDKSVLHRVSQYVRRWPSRDLYPKILALLFSYPSQFKQARSTHHLCRLMMADYFFSKRLANEVSRYPKKRHLFLRLLKTKLEFPFGSKPVLGIVVTFNLLEQREVFEEQHMIEAIRRFVPLAQPVADSFLEQVDKRYRVQSVYIEVEKERGFSSQEIALLQKLLPIELKGCFEQLVPLTFMRRNEEEVYRNIVTLRDQLRSPQDIPQATITFEEQTQFDLFFTVVILRVIEKEHASIQALFTKANPDMHYIPDRVDVVGQLPPDHQKEVTIFRLKLSKSQFFRKDRSVNLYTARKMVVARIDRALGQVRDFNGGLILKQNERLEDFLSIMSQFHDEFLLENFFYSITPIAMQSILQASIIRDWFLINFELMKREMDHPFHLAQKCEGEIMLIAVRIDDESIKVELINRISKLEIPSLQLASSEFRMNGSVCFSFLYKSAIREERERLFSEIENVLREWSQSHERECILRMALPECEPTLDPRINRHDPSAIILNMLFEGLTRIGRDGKPQMAAAQSYDVSADFMSYTFHLREANWSNGEKVTALDFEYAWKQALASQSLFAEPLFLIKNAKAIRAKELSIDQLGIHALDDRTFLVELEHPAPYFLEACAHISSAAISRSIDGRYPGWSYQAGETYVSNGPFRLTLWEHGRNVVVEKNPSYWDAEAVNLDRIEIALVDPQQDEMRLFKSGERDIFGRPMSGFPRIGLTPIEGKKRVDYPLQANFALCFNTESFPFNHKKLRQAFAYAIDREALKADVPQEFAEASFSLLPRTLSLCDEPSFPGRDSELARDLFREGLGEIGFVRSDFPRLDLLICSPHREAMLKALADQWRETFSIDIYPKYLNQKQHHHALISGQFQLGCTEFRALWEDPLHLLERFMKKSEPLNFSRFEHVEYLKLIERAKSEQDDRYLLQAEKLLAEEMPMVPLYALMGNYLKQEELQGECPSRFFQMDFKWSYIS